MKRKPLRYRIAEMIGRVDPRNAFLSPFVKGYNRLFGRNLPTIDYSQTDYELTKAIYYAAKVGNKGEEYQYAAALGRPIINIMTGFVLGQGFKIELDKTGMTAAQVTALTAAENRINDWIDSNQSDIYDFVKFGYRDGDSYFYIDELGDLSLLDPSTVEVLLDPVSGDLTGFDVTETIVIRDPATNQDVTWIYIKQYRTDSVRYLRYQNNSDIEHAEILYERVYTIDGAVALETGDDGEPLDYDPNYITDRLLPIVPLHNEPEPKAVYGNSEFQNLLLLFRRYSDVLKQATKGNIYNSTPVLVLKNVQDPNALAGGTEAQDDAARDKDGKSKLEWDQDSVLYTTGDGDAKFLQANAFMDDVSKLLEIYFFLFVQGSETPEFAFGTAVASSNASVDSQMPIFVRKIDRKRRQLSDTLQQLIQTFIERQQLIADPDFIDINGLDVKVRINYPPVADEDKKLTLDAVTWALGAGIMSNKTALELVFADQVKDASQELKDAAKDAKAAADATGAVPDQQTRLFTELLKQSGGSGNNNNNGGGSSNTPTPAPTNGGTDNGSGN